MAKATAICTCKVCGCKFEKTAVRRNRSEATSWEEWAERTFDICPECERKEREAHAAELAKQAAADGMPALTGTPKQVTWAESLRARFIELSEKDFQHYLNILKRYEDEGNEKDAAKLNENIQLYEKTRNYILLHISNASWWIENRGDAEKTIYWFFKENRLQIEADDGTSNAPAKNEPPERNDDVLTPENAKYGIATVEVNESGAEAIYPKDDTFRAAVKAAGFTWKSATMCWTVIASETNGTAVERAADAIARLLDAGFSVRCSCAEAREKAISGDYKPFTTKWVRGGKNVYKGWLTITLPSRYDRENRDEIYKASRKIHGSKYDGAIRDGAVVVPAAQHSAVEDFAEIYGYSLTASARQTIEEYENAKLGAVKPAAPVTPEKTDVLGEILHSSDEILPELEDR